MSAIIGSTSCGACGGPIDEPTNIPVAERKPCPCCGSLTRSFRVCAHDSLQLHEKLGLKQKRAGLKKPILESISGDDLYRVSGKWNKISQVIDRVNNRYKKIVTDPETGKILRYCDEPL